MPSNVAAKYASILSYSDNWNASEQNPSYVPYNIDRWGDYQYNGKDRHSVYNYWVNQNPDANFDPAAWQLKGIKLPSGGELQVHYEQNEYSFVQDRPAMAMVSVAQRDGNKYHLNVGSDLGLSSAQADEMANSIRSLFIGKDEGERKGADHMLFNFVYSLEGTNNAYIHDCNVERISGYVKVKDVGTEVLGGVSYVWVELGDENKEFTLPENVCADYVHSNRANIIQFGSCDASSVGIPTFETEARADNQDKTNHTSAFHAIMSLLVDFGDYYDDDKNCKEIDYANSYLRVPMPRSKAKLGGGVRVKRVLMYDPGLESGEDAALYGTEYAYETVGGLSSGVATNEPVVGREENAFDWFD